MTDNRTFWKAFHSLVHPLAVMAIILLLLNDHWLRYAHPSWLTGKLGDFAWLVFAPFITALLFAWVIPQGWKQPSRFVGWLSIGFIGIWFATAKTIPFVHELTTQTLYAIVGWEGQLRLDVTDLLTLPALLLSAYIWRQASDEKVSLKPLAYVAFGLGILGTLASSNPNFPDYGLKAVCQNGEFVYSTSIDTWYDEDKIAYISYDGGLTWNKSESEELHDCLEPSVLSGTDLQVRWSQGGAIETSNDGQTWTVEYDLAELRQEIRNILRIRNREEFSFRYKTVEYEFGPYDATFDPKTGNIIFAMGWDGILVRYPEGTYEWVDVAYYRLPEIEDLSSIGKSLFLEFWLALATTFLVVTTSTAYIRQNFGRWSTQFIKAGWIAYVGLLIATFFETADWTMPISHRGDFIPLMSGFLSLISLIFLGIPLSLGALWDILRNFRSVAIPIMLAGLGNGALFILPFILWTQGRIPRYIVAYVFAVFLTLLGLYATRIYLKRILPVLEPEKMKRDEIEKDKLQKHT